MLQCIFLSDLVTADGRYLKSFIFDPGPFKRRSNYHFPQECPSQKHWETWFNFWHSYVLTGDKLEVPLGNWINPTHRKWLWYTSPRDELHRIEDGGYLPLSAITSHTKNTFNSVVHPNLEREDPQGSCNEPSCISTRCQYKVLMTRM